MMEGGSMKSYNEGDTLDLLWVYEAGDWFGPHQHNTKLPVTGYP